MDNKHIIRINRYISNMPSLPTTVTKILEICNDPRTSPADLNQVISLDPVLMGKVMKLINSAYYGLSQEITSLVRAIIMLGINTVKNLALSTAVLGTIGSANNFNAINMKGFWRHSLGTGVISKLIAKRRMVDKKFLEEYFIAGLLHDIGKIPLNNILSQEYLLAISLSDREHIPLYLSEQRTFQSDHTSVGKMIIDSWKLTEEINDGVTFHHNLNSYEGEYKDIVYTIAVANYFANILEIGFSGDRYPEKIPGTALDHLNISMDYLEEIEDLVNDEIEKAQIFLHITA